MAYLFLLIFVTVTFILPLYFHLICYRDFKPETKTSPIFEISAILWFFYGALLAANAYSLFSDNGVVIAGTIIVAAAFPFFGHLLQKSLGPRSSLAVASTGITLFVFATISTTGLLEGHDYGNCFVSSHSRDIALGGILMIALSLGFILLLRAGLAYKKKWPVCKSRQAERQSLWLGLFLLAALIAPMLINWGTPGRQSNTNEIRSVKSQLANFATALDLYKLDFGRYPEDPEGLQALVSPGKGKRPYLKVIPKDAWAQSYLYRCKESEKTRKPVCEVLSLGPDGKEGSKDDQRITIGE